MIKKLIQGVGINDANYKVHGTVNGIRVKCHFYGTWTNILVRCYNPKIHNIFPNYKGCTVCEEWKYFSNFKEWMEQQDWQGKHIDKDILVVGNKIYSPDTCVFVSPLINSFLTENKSSKGAYMVGVHWSSFEGKFIAQCQNPIERKKERIGAFNNEIDAHEAWKKRKREFAYTLADSQNDQRVCEALKDRYK